MSVAAQWPAQKPGQCVGWGQMTIAPIAGRRPIGPPNRRATKFPEQGFAWEDGPYEGFAQIIIGPFLKGLDHRVGRGIGGHHDAQKIGALLFQ